MAEGACSALIADAADDPGPADATGWGRVVVIPEMGSVLVAGHSPLGAFVLRAAHAALSVPLGRATPLACDEDAEMVDAAEAWELRLDEELDRDGFLVRGTKPPFGMPSALHAWRLMFWKLTGGATAVIGEVVFVEGVVVVVVVRVRRHFSCTLPVFRAGLAGLRKTSRSEPEAVK